MDYHRIELEPAPSRFFDRDAGPAGDGSLGPAAQLLGTAYAERVARYERELDQGMGTRRRRALPAGSRYPQHDAALPGRTVTVVYDPALDRRLLEIYVVHGWPGIQIVGRSLKRTASRWPDRALVPWRHVVRSFFDDTCGQLHALVRRELVALERRAADELVLQLNLSAQMVNDAWTRLDIRTKTTDAQGREQWVITDEPSPSLDTPIRRRRLFYSLGTPNLAEQLHQVVQRLVKARERLRTLEDQRAGTQAEPDAGRAELQQQIEGLYDRVQKLCPAALLAVPLLQHPVSREDLGQTLGEVLQQFFGESERIARALPGDKSWVAEVVPDLAGHGRPDESPERLAADAAITRAGNDPKYLSLLSDHILDRLAGWSREAGPLRYVVRSQYLVELLDQLQQEQEREELMAALLGPLFKVAALLSLAGLLTPVGAVVRGIAGALDLGLLACQVHTVVGRLALLDRQLAARMVELDRQDAEAVIHLAELAQMRPEYVEQLTHEVAAQVGLITAAGAWPAFKLLLQLRGYYADLETLLGASGAADQG